MADYTPSTQAIRGRIIQRGAGWGFYSLGEFDRWLAAHDAEVRASVLAEQGEPDWEYGISSGCGSVDYVGTRESVEARVASFEKAGAPLRPPESIVRRRKVGLWLPVEENGENT